MLKTAQSETGSITRLLLRSAADAFRSPEKLASEWQRLGYTSGPDYQQALDEYDQFLSILRETGAQIDFAPPDPKLSIDSIYVRDSLVVTDRGLILCNMGKKARADEPGSSAEFLQKAGLPVLGTISETGRIEGGDLVWFDERTLVVGLGYRTNAEGIRQLWELTSDFVKDIVVVPLPHWKGEGDVMHLMSNYSPIATDLAVVYSPLLTVPFRTWLLDRGVTLVEVPDEEYETMACNVLATGPRQCLMLEGNPVTRQRLEEQGVEVLTYKGDQISRLGAGGPTCLTRPLERESADRES